MDLAGTGLKKIETRTRFLYQLGGYVQDRRTRVGLKELTENWTEISLKPEARAGQAEPGQEIGWGYRAESCNKMELLSLVGAGQRGKMQGDLVGWNCQGILEPNPFLLIT